MSTSNNLVINYFNLRQTQRNLKKNEILRVDSK